MCVWSEAVKGDGTMTMQNLKLYPTQPAFPTCAAGEYLTYHSEDLYTCTTSTVVEQWHPECEVCPVAIPSLLVVLVTAILTTFVVRLLGRIWPSEICTKEE
jgi:hypothetical protein